MSKTNISWATHVVNFVGGCTHCSPGCDNCWAATVASTRLKNNPLYRGLTVNGRWTGEIRLTDKPIRMPGGKPKEIFVNSMSDLFHEKVPDGFIMNLWRMMGLLPQHKFLILTKRAERMREWCSKWSDTIEDNYGFKNARGPEAVRRAHKSKRAHLFADMIELWGQPPEGSAYPAYDWADGMSTWPTVLPNMYFGLTICNQKEADEKLPVFLQIPGQKWLSIEPCLGEINFKYIWDDEDYYCPACGYMGEECESDEDGELICPECGGYENTVGFDKVSVQPIDDLPFPDVDQVIFGGESGPNARPMHPDWARSIRDQCKAAGVAFYFKQWGDHRKDLQIDGVLHNELIWRIDK